MGGKRRVENGGTMNCHQFVGRRECFVVSRSDSPRLPEMLRNDCGTGVKSTCAEPLRPKKHAVGLCCRLVIPHMHCGKGEENTGL